MQNESKDWFLGRIEFDVTKDKFTRLRPLARSALNGAGWDMIGSELTSVFPTRGQVCWFNAREELRVNRLVEFQLAEVANFDSERKPEKFQAIHVVEAIEVIEWPPEDEPRLREALRGRGVHFRKPPVGRTIFKVNEDRWIGPFSLLPIDAEHWGLPTDMDFDAIPLFDAPIAPLSTVRVEGVPHTILRTSAEAIVPARFLNWQSDVDVLRSALKRLHKLDVAAFKSTGLTYAAFDAYLAAVENTGGLPPIQLAKERARAERIKQLRRDLPLAPQLVEEIVAALESFGVVKERLRERCAEIEQQMKAEVEERMIAERAQLQQLEETIANKRRQSGDLERQLQGKQKTLESDLTIIDEAMQEKLRRLKESPAQAVADIVASSAIFSALLPSTSSPRHRRAIILPPKAGGEVVEDTQAVKSRVTAAVTRAGVDPNSAVPLLAAATAGIVPICSGAAAVEALHEMGRSICAGNTWSLPLSPITTSLADILAPSTTGIAGLRDLIAAAHESPNELWLAIIEGVNLGASDGFLLPLLALADREKSQSGANVPLLSDTGEICSWPDNLLAFATVADVRTRLPLPRKIWQHSPLFLFDWLPGDVGSAIPDQPPARVSGAYWRKLRTSVESQTQTVPSALQGNPPTRRLANRLHAALSALAPEADAAALVRTHVLSPAIASSKGELPPDFSPLAQSHFRAALSLISEPPDSI